MTFLQALDDGVSEGVIDGVKQTKIKMKKYRLLTQYHYRPLIKGVFYSEDYKILDTGLTVSDMVEEYPEDWEEITEPDHEKILLKFKDWWNSLDENSDDRIFMTQATIERFLEK